MDERFGKFTRKNLLGAGGMGEVWQAWDDHLGRTVALKFLKGRTPEDLARFQREAQIASRLTHPNIAAIYEVGPDFIAMQFVEGTTLGPRKDVAKLISVAARAVHFAHEQGIVHRDLKPANLMVTPGGHLFVMDFGLAKSTGHGAEGSTSGAIVGTPPYMAPEQARGERVDARTDVYGLGATLYTVLTGRRPFKGADMVETLRQVLNDEVTPPRRIVASIEPDLETIVLKCLEKDPERRYPSAEALAADLDRHLEGRPILAHPPSTIYALKKFLARRTGVVAGAGVGLVAAVLVAAILVPGWRREAEARRAGEGALAVEKAKAESLKELGSLWAEVILAKQGLYKTSENPRKVVAGIRAAVDKVGEFIKGHPKFPQGYYIRARGLLYLNDLQGAESALRSALRIEEGFVPGHTLMSQVFVMRYARWVGQQADARGSSAGTRFSPGKPLLELAKEALRNAAAEVPLATWGLARTAEDDVAEVLFRAFWAYFVEGSLPQALRILDAGHREHPSEEFCCWIAMLQVPSKEALRWADEALRIMPHFTLAFVSRGYIREHLGDINGAMEDLNRALAIEESCISALFNRGGVRRLTGDLQGALEDYGACLRIDPTFASCYNNRGNVNRQLRNLEAALADFDRAIELEPGFATPYMNRGIVRRELKDLDGALQDYNKALSMAPGFAEAYSSRGNVRRERKDFDGALADFAKAIELEPGSATVYNNRACVWRDLGNLDKAIGDFSTAISLDPRYLDCYMNRAEMLHRMGRNAESQADFRKALEVAPADWSRRAEVERWLRAQPQ